MKGIIVATMTIMWIAMVGMHAQADAARAATEQCNDTIGDNFRAQREEVCRLITPARRGDGVILDEALSRVAQAHAEDMAKHNYFSHYSRNGDAPIDRLHKAGIYPRARGENIGRGYQTPADVMRGWMRSSGHRRNIQDPAFNKVGIGFYDYYWVQMFTN